jgi:hypothetical protein
VKRQLKRVGAWVRAPRQIPVLGSLAAAIAVFVAVQEFPTVKVLQTYGPNVVAMFLGVAFTVGAVQHFLDRETERRLAPAKRAAIAAAREVMFPLRHMASQTITALAPDRQGFMRADLIGMAPVWRQLLIGADLTVSSGIHDPVSLAPIPLNAFIANEVRASFDAYRVHAGLITQHCPLDIADTIQDLIQGRGNPRLHLLGWGIAGFQTEPDQKLDDLQEALIGAETALNAATVPWERSFPAVYQMNRGA